METPQKNNIKQTFKHIDEVMSDICDILLSVRDSRGSRLREVVVGVVEQLKGREGQDVARTECHKRCPAHETKFHRDVSSEGTKRLDRTGGAIQ